MAKTLFTIGYEGLDIEAFLGMLTDAGIEAVADVRAVAASRKPGFSKTKLAEHLRSTGLAYRHLVALGDPKPGREAARAGRYGEFERIFAHHLATSAARSALEDLAAFADGQPTCLMCFERDPAFCHRSRVASALLGSGFVVQHLIADEPDVHLPSIRARRDPRQGAASPQRHAW